MAAPRIAIISPHFAGGSLTRALVDRLTLGYPQNGSWQTARLDIATLFPTRSEARADAEALGRARGRAVTSTLASALNPRGSGHTVDGVLIVGGSAAQTGIDGSPSLDPASAEAAELVARISAINKEKNPAIFVAPGLGGEGETHLESLKGTAAFFAAGLLSVATELPALDRAIVHKANEALLVAPLEGDELGPTAVDGLLAVLPTQGPWDVRTVQFLEGEAFWRAAEEGRFSRRLLAACLSRSDAQGGSSAEDGRTQDLLEGGALRTLARRPAGCFLEHGPGRRSAIVLLAGAVMDHSCAAATASRLRGSIGAHTSTQLLIPSVESMATTAALALQIERFFLAPASFAANRERGLRATRILDAAARSRQAGGIRVALSPVTKP